MAHTVGGTGRSTPLVLVVEDEPAIATAVAHRMRAEGWTAEIAADGITAVEVALRLVPDVVVLDVMLPGLDGLEVCRRIQAERPIPVIMLTARDDETDMLVGLGVGADDYLTKPFSMRELVARTKTLLRRVERSAQLAVQQTALPAITVGDVVVDRAQRRVTRAGAPIHLTPTEFDLLVTLALSPRTVLTREKLLADVWDWVDASGTRTVDSHVKALRRKLGPDLIRTVHGVGYAFEPAAGPMSTPRHAGRARLDVRPLDSLSSIKIKLGVLVVATVTLAAFLTWIGLYNHLGPRWTLPLAIVISVVAVQVLAHGMTSPLREMTAAARAMAQGDYSQRVRATSRDEVGQLAGAFNTMADDLQQADTLRRELVANVSHELRTPVAALQAQLENMVDGVSPMDRATLEVALAQTERLGRLVTDLLDLSRLEAGAVRIEPAPVELRDVPRRGGRRRLAGLPGQGARLRGGDRAGGPRRGGGRPSACTRSSRTCCTTRCGTPLRAAGSR